jgi:hypothetical protein
VADAFKLAVLDLGGAAAFSIGAHPKMLLFNRVLGTQDDTALPELEEWFGSRRCTFAVSVRPGADLERVWGFKTRVPPQIHGFSRCELSFDTLHR